MAWSSSGLGHRPLKAKIGGSNPLQATTVIFCEPFEAGHQLGGFAFFVPEVHQRHRAVLVDRHVRLGIYGLSLIRALNPCYFVSFDTGNGRNYEIAWILLLSQRAQCGDSKETPGQSVTVKSSSSIVPTVPYYFVIAYIFGAQNDEIVQILRWRPPPYPEIREHVAGVRQRMRRSDEVRSVRRCAFSSESMRLLSIAFCMAILWVH